MKDVCILTAGIGSRMGPYSSTVNKAILPINFKGLISHIIEKFDKDNRFIIALGHKSKQVKSYIDIAHPHINVNYVYVKNYDGHNSGPGHSLYCCKESLKKEFYFVACDTLWSDENITETEEESWFGVKKLDSIEDAIDYCNFEYDKDNIVKINDKRKVDNLTNVAFTGLCYIKDYKLFWEGLESKKTINGEIQISNGIENLVLQRKAKLKYISWIDVGDYKKYKNEVIKYENYDFSKQDEFLYFAQNKVIKYFNNDNIAKNRVLKARLNQKVFPEILDSKNNFYSYNFLDGKTLYKKNDIRTFNALLNFLKNNLWDLQLKDYDSDLFHDSCELFYIKKTKQRIELFQKKYPNYEKENTLINGSQIPTLENLLTKKIDWDRILKCKAAFIHGDLQFDNILCTSDNKFKLLDWRQDFGGLIEYGDIYYDFAKLYGGIILNYDLIKLNMLTYEEADNVINFDFATRFSSNAYIEKLENYIIINNFDLKKVKQLVPIIFINMAPLHHYPFDKLLFNLCKYMIHNLNDYDK